MIQVITGCRETDRVLVKYHSVRVNVNRKMHAAVEIIPISGWQSTQLGVLHTVQPTVLGNLTQDAVGRVEVVHLDQGD